MLYCTSVQYVLQLTGLFLLCFGPVRCQTCCTLYTRRFLRVHSATVSKRAPVNHAWYFSRVQAAAGAHSVRAVGFTPRPLSATAAGAVGARLHPDAQTQCGETSKLIQRTPPLSPEAFVYTHTFDCQIPIVAR